MTEKAGTAPAIRKLGRPNRFSREAVLAGAIEVLTDTPLENFSLALVAKRIGAGVMSLYTYFPSRDSLLLAVADELFFRFEPPEPREDWRDVVLDWLRATVRLFDAYPVAIKLSIWDGHVSPAWLRTWFPIVKLIKRQGLEGAALAFAVSWFSTTSMSFVISQMTSPENRRSDAIANIGVLDRAEQLFATELWLDFAEVDRQAVLEFGFDTIIAGLERLVRDGEARSDGGRYTAA